MENILGTVTISLEYYNKLKTIEQSFLDKKAVAIYDFGSYQSVVIMQETATNNFLLEKIKDAEAKIKRLEEKLYTKKTWF